MTLAMGNTDKLAEFRAEAERLGIKVEPPSINRSDVEFEVAGNTIHYALAALRGVGRQAVESIVAARGERPFADLADFARRINPRAVNKRVLESLVAAGAFDAIEPNRARRLCRRRRASLPPRSARTTTPRSASPSCSAARRRRSRSSCRRSSRGCRPSGCSANMRRSAFSSAAIRSTIMPRRSSGCACSPGPNSARAVKAGAGAGRVAGTVVARTERRTKNGTKMGIIGLSDPSGHYEAVLFAEGLGAISRPARAGKRRCCCSSPPRSKATKCAPASNRSSRSTRRRRKCRRACACSCATSAPIEGVARRLEPIEPASAPQRRAITATARSAWC